MSERQVISPAFEAFLADSGPEVKREAIVIYKPSEPPEVPLRGSLRELKKRLDYIKGQAAAQKATRDRVFRSYVQASRKRAPKVTELAHSPVGGGALPVSTFEVTRKTLRALEDQPNVLAVLPNQRVGLIGPKRVNYEALAKDELEDGLTWGLRKLDIPTVWDKSKGKGVNVAVLDTGVHGDHPALQGRVKEFVVIDPLGRRIETKDGATFDYDQHGTHVCGTIAGGKAGGVAIGVAPEANLLVASINFGSSFLSNVVAGLVWAVEKGADIVSMSIGMSFYDPNIDELFKVLLAQYGIVPVVAIGNENHGSTSCPGNAFHSLSVGALEKQPHSRFDVASFSSGASLVFPGQAVPMVTKPDVVAPGAQVYSCIPPAKTADGVFEYTYMDGTSMATPHVAGVLALLMAAKSATPVRAIIDAVKQTADHPAGNPNLRPDNRWGYGLINPAKALRALS